MMNHGACLLSSQEIEKGLEPLLGRAQDGELFLESVEDEALVLEHGVIKSVRLIQTQGYGLRAVYDPFVKYAYGPLLNQESFPQAIEAVGASQSSYSKQAIASSYDLSLTLKSSSHPFQGTILEHLAMYVDILSQIDVYIRQKDHRVCQVQAVLSRSIQHVEIYRLHEEKKSDVRPMISLKVLVIVAHKEKRGIGACGDGGRGPLKQFGSFEQVKRYLDEALRLAILDLEAMPAPAGEFPVVLGAGSTGILLHEAIGHGLEGDSNRRKTSKFHNMMGQMIASEHVNVMDSGLVPEGRGSFSMDDEGTAPQETLLIENGRLVGYMQDRMNARMMGMKTTGNCRRESYASIPMVRMTNTFMQPKEESKEEMIRSISKGILAMQFGSGEVDISSGNFVFSTTEAYMIENGHITYPIKGVTLIGNGPDILKKIVKVGHDFAFGPGVGTCGKDGQSVPVGVGQPSVMISSMTIGGTQATLK